LDIKTVRFGTLEVEPDRIITFKDGVPGFGDHQFILLTPVETAPFCWLQSVEDPAVAFVVADPKVFKPNYDPILSDDVYKELELGTEEECLILVVAVVPDDIKKMTANLAAPIIVNVDKRLAKQEVLSSGDYPLRYNIYEGLHAERVGA
jgi:flagellar assembly factor FliW